MKRILCLMCAICVMGGMIPFVSAAAEAPGQLRSLAHNCPNTGKMMPETFDPSVTSYVLTVADWVSNVCFTPVANGAIYVNGTQVVSGNATSYFQMTDEPQMVTIQVVDGQYSTTYTVFLQRRPSARRTRVSAGYVNEIYYQNGEYYIAADLVTINYKSNSYADGSRSTFENTSSYLYRYAVDPHCVFYYTENGQTQAAQDIFAFQTMLDLNTAQEKPLFKIIYIEDKIVCMTPYEEDF